MNTEEQNQENIEHGVVEDIFAVTTSTLIAAFGIQLLSVAQVVTGGMAGLTLLISSLINQPFGLLYPLISVPFLILGLLKRGLNFTLRSMTAIALLAIWTLLIDELVQFESISAWFAAVFGNLLIGVGMLMMFRHRTSLGGFNIIALLVQDKFHVSAGKTQMVLDVLVVGGFAIYSFNENSIWAILGAITLNLVLALNHRPDRYTA